MRPTFESWHRLGGSEYHLYQHGFDLFVTQILGQWSWFILKDGWLVTGRRTWHMGPDECMGCAVEAAAARAGKPSVGVG